MTQAIIIGYSGHGIVVSEAAIKSSIQLLGYTEKRKSDSNPYNLSFLGDETQDDFLYWNSCKNYIIGIGSNQTRAEVANRLIKKGVHRLIIAHPSASFADDIQIGDGTFIARNVAVNPLVRIGENVILNTSCSIDHECLVADNAHIAPGAVLAGNVKIGIGAFVGANSVIKEGVSIGENAIIGAGSVIVDDVKPDAVIVGNPGKPIK